MGFGRPALPLLYTCILWPMVLTFNWITGTRDEGKWIEFCFELMPTQCTCFNADCQKKKKSLDFFLIFISLCLSVVKQIYLRHFLAKLPWLICVLEQSLLLLYQLKVKITRDERARKLISIQMKIIPINADKITNGGPCGPTTKAVCSITCFTISD